MHPFTFILFGSTGDLAQKKIMPALFKLYCRNALPAEFSIIAFSRRGWTDEDYHSFIKPSLEKIDSEAKRDVFLKHITYIEGQFQEVSAYEKIKHKVTNPAFFYLAVQPEFYERILEGLSQAQLLADPTSKIMVEKPFGHDEQSASLLKLHFEKNIKPEQVLLVDHYLAKEGLQVFKKDFDGSTIKSLHIRLFEKIGIEGRGDFYDHVGALLDVGQNHLMELLATALLDTKNLGNSDTRTKTIASLSVVKESIFGQYEDYTKEPEVAADSQTDTYFKLFLESNLEKWLGVSLILESGKSMAEKRADITCTFSDGSEKIFDIQQSTSGSDAYEILIENALLGNREYAVGINEVLSSWHVLEPVLENRAKIAVKKYPSGTNGPHI